MIAMVSNPVLPGSKCEPDVFSRGAGRYPGILKILAGTLLQFEAFSLRASSSVVYCCNNHTHDVLTGFEAISFFREGESHFHVI